MRARIGGHVDGMSRVFHRRVVDGDKARRLLLNDCCAAMDHLRSALDHATDRPELATRLHGALLIVGEVLDKAGGPDRSALPDRKAGRPPLR